jgi:hypothetical protein
MNILDQYNQTVLGKNQQTLDISKEKFQVSSTSIAKNKFNITVTNTGSLPINFTKIWVQNTTDTDWVRSYVPVNGFVGPGSTLKNIGQNIPLYAKSTQSYNIKLITSRGNTQQFNVNSVGSTPLNIQLYAFPSTVSSGFTTQIVMIVTNNSTGTLVNLTPTASASPITDPSCILGSASPQKYSTLLPGGTAVFTWSLTASGSANKICTVTASLQNGFPNQSVQTQVTITQVTLASTTYAQNAGVLTVDYTSFKYAKTNDAQWNTGWDLPSTDNYAFQLILQNNNQTQNSVLYLSKNTALLMSDTANAGNSRTFYLTDHITFNTGTGFNISPYCSGTGDYCASIPYQGTSVLTFASSTPDGSSSPQNLNTGHSYIGFVLMYGKFNVNNPPDNSGKYGQNLPYMAIMVG